MFDKSTPEVTSSLSDPVCGMDVSTDSDFHVQHKH